MLKAAKMVNDCAISSPREGKISDVAYKKGNLNREGRARNRTAKLSINANVRLHIPMSRIGKGKLKKTLGKSIECRDADEGP